jgi:hypothetical protein
MKSLLVETLSIGYPDGGIVNEALPWMKAPP